MENRYAKVQIQNILEKYHNNGIEFEIDMAK